VFNVTGVRQHGLLELEPAPLGNDLVLAIFKLAQLDGMPAAFMANVNNAKCAADHRDEHQQEE
jgi:hypothetical protein